MDFPKSNPATRLLNGRFTDGNPATGLPASRDLAQWGNLVTDELNNVVIDGGLTPNEAVNTQVRDAIRNMITTRLPLINNGRVWVDNVTFTAAVTTEGQAVYYNTANNRYAPAIAGSNPANRPVGIAHLAAREVTFFGRTGAIANATFTPGSRYYLSATAGGQITTTAPADVVQMGIAISGNELYVDIDPIGATQPSIVNLHPLAASFPTIANATNVLASTGVVGPTGGKISVPSGTVIVMNEDLGNNICALRQVTTAAWTSGEMAVSSIYYLRCQVIGGILIPYIQQGAENDTVPASLKGTINGTSGGGFDSTPIDCLLARIVTGAAGTAPIITNLANSERLFAHFESTGGHTAYYPTSITAEYSKTFVLNWARTPRTFSSQCWIGQMDALMHGGLYRISQSITRYSVGAVYWGDWYPPLYTSPPATTCGMIFDCSC